MSETTEAEALTFDAASQIAFAALQDSTVLLAVDVVIRERRPDGSITERTFAWGGR